MNAALLIGVCTVGIPLGIILYGRASNPTTVFLGTWLLVIAGSSVNPYSAYPVAESTYRLILIGVIGFTCGSLITRLNGERLDVGPLARSATFTLNSRVLAFLTCAALAVLAVTATRGAQLLIAGNGIGYLRYDARSAVLGNGQLLPALFLYIAQPICYLLIPIAASQIVRRSPNRLFISATILATILLTISDGGRFVLLYWVAHLILMSALLSDSALKNVLRHPGTALMIVAAVWIATAITLSRGSSIGRTLYVYVSGSIPNLDAHIDLLPVAELGVTHGASSLQGVVRPMITLLGTAGLVSEPELFARAETISMSLNEPTQIAPNVTINSFVTMFYYFYLDFGLPGVLAFSVVFGLLSALVYQLVMARPTARSILAYALLVQAILLGTFRFEFASFSYAMAFAYLILLTSGSRTRAQAATAPNTRGRTLGSSAEPWP